MDITNFIVSNRENALVLGGYNSYRAQLSRRLATLRKKLGKSSSKGKIPSIISSITENDINQNHEFVHLLLLTSERAWAHAMHMKSMHSTDAGTKAISGSTRSHIVSRLRKASTYAQHLSNLLLNLTATRATEIDQLEARAYCSSLFGSGYFEYQNWEKCLVSYSEARVIYIAVAAATSKDTFKDLLSSTIDPSIRFSAYQLKLGRDQSIPAIARRYFPRSSNALLTSTIERLDPKAMSEQSLQVGGPASGSGDEPTEIKWRSRRVKLEDASVALALANVSAVSENLSNFLSSPASAKLPPKDKAAAYDEILIAIQDAVDTTKRSMDELTAEGVTAGGERMQDLQVVRTAVNYALVGWRIGRNRVLTGLDDGANFETTKNNSQPHKEKSTARKLADFRERIALYDATIQSLDSIHSFPGVAADASLLGEVNGTRRYFQALKCLSLAHSHALLQDLTKSLALLARAIFLLTQPLPLATSGVSKPHLVNIDVSNTQAQALQQHVQRLATRYRALVDMQGIAQPAGATNVHSQPLIEMLNTFPARQASEVLRNLVTYPPRIVPIPLKPLFLDVAWNYIEYPGRGVAKSAAVEQKQKAVEDPVKEKGKPEGKKGWFGFGS
ncbi:MAG: hypothetical protein M1829_005459 [Trizodia sp. TS-e1964]|nr:MAG: hypothetical protein M1829_005459 [Trizodia sp. TS-e1964]